MPVLFQTGCRRVSASAGPDPAGNQAVKTSSPLSIILPNIAARVNNRIVIHFFRANRAPLFWRQDRMTRRQIECIDCIELPDFFIDMADKGSEQI